MGEGSVLLNEMGVGVGRFELEEAQVSAIHYGKNVILTDHSLPMSYIQEIKKADINNIYDANQTDFRNNGHSYKYHSNTFEFILYDKLKDLAKAKLSPKRSVEKDKFIQSGLFDLLEKSEKDPFEVLRLELRLNRRHKIKSELNKIGIPYKLPDLTFKNLFSEDIAKRACLSQLKNIEQALSLVSEKNSDSFTTRAINLIADNPHIKPRMILEFLAFNEIVAEHDIRTARLLLDPRGKHWFRIKDKYESIKIDKRKDNKIDLLIKAVNEFKTVRLKDYPQLMLNNVN